MINLRYQFNASMTTLPEFGKVKYNCVPVRLKNGDFQRVSWLGYIDIEHASFSPTRRPVKLLVRAYSVSVGMPYKWVDLSTSEALLGVLCDRGAYCIVEEGKPKIIAI